MARQGGTAEEEETIRLREGLMMKEREEDTNHFHVQMIDRQSSRLRLQLFAIATATTHVEVRESFACWLEKQRTYSVRYMLLQYSSLFLCL